MNFKVALAAAALLATQSFAIIGIGGHYTPGLGTKMDGMDKPVNITSDGQIKLMHQGFDGVMQGFGFKLWIDLLPIIDIEATLNFHMGSYDAILYVAESKVSLDPNEAAADPTYKEVPLEIELGGTPFTKSSNERRATPRLGVASITKRESPILSTMATWLYTSVAALTARSISSWPQTKMRSPVCSSIGLV